MSKFHGVSLSLLCLFAFTNDSFSQTILEFSIDQPSSPLSAEAGVDQEFDGVIGIVLGGNPAAIGGFGEYLYEWNNSEFLDDPNSPNPFLVNLSGPTTFTLSVTDVETDCVAEDEVFVDFVLSISNVLPENQIKVYPNPFFDQLNIESVAVLREVMIMDYTGKTIHRASIEGSNYTYDSYKLGAGLYFAIVTLEDLTTQTFKICKQD